MSPAALQLLQGGKEERRLLLEELYARYGGSVYGRCLYLLRDPSRAEDAMQDVFARAFQNLFRFRAEASPQTWLLKIATHHCLNLLRSERAGWRRLFERDAKSEPAGTGGPEVLELRESLRRVLSRFDLETQAAVIHYHLDEMTLEEVAALLGRSVPTIRKRLERFAERAGEELKR